VIEISINAKEYASCREMIIKTSSVEQERELLINLVSMIKQYIEQWRKNNE
jgi:hypothetical protein